MLTRLYATNYRCLVNFEFKPNAKQLIIGTNGTGKSTVFDVLAMLRDFAVRGLPCEGSLGGRTRTDWQRVAEQRFELDVKGNGGEYRYRLIVDEQRGSPPRPRVKEETLTFNSNPLLRFVEGQVQLFDEVKKSAPRLEFPLDWNRSALATAEADAQRRNEAKFTWFKLWLDNLTHVRINPWAMSSRSERESRYLSTDIGNFTDWYRHLSQASGKAVQEAISSLREVIPNLEELNAQPAGLDVRLLQARMRRPDGTAVDQPLHELSEGQRALIVLYLLMYCAVGEDSLLLIDEPDNFIALAEIQPWLFNLVDRVDETKGQVMLVSHHPELLNQLARQSVILDRPGGAETRIRPFTSHADSSLTPAELVARGWEQDVDGADHPKLRANEGGLNSRKPVGTGKKRRHSRSNG